VAAVLWIALSGAGLWLLMALLLIHASGYRAANILAFMVVFPLAMLGGSFFPFEAMPDWLAGIGRLTPNGWAVLELRRLLAGPLDPGRLALACAGLAAAGGVMFPLILRRLRRGFAL
jgi:ABC-type multidrug transport system permease subunit